MNIRTEPKPKCPDCAGIMVLRTRKSDGVKFWGCSTWPECTGTRNIKSDGTPEDDDWGWWADPDNPRDTL